MTCDPLAAVRPEIRALRAYRFDPVPDGLRAKLDFNESPADVPAAAKEGAAFAAEHVELMGRAAERYAARFAATSGAVFVGSDTPTAFGDYLAGPNHVLPTGGAARSFSGLSVRDFLRWGRSVSVPPAAARKLGPAAATLARFEGLEGHARSLDLRCGR